MQPKETVGRQTASQVVPELAFHKSRDRTLTRLLAGEESLQLLGDDDVQQGLFRLARNILERSVQHGEASSRALARVRALVSGS